MCEISMNTVSAQALASYSDDRVELLIESGWMLRIGTACMRLVAASHARRWCIHTHTVPSAREGGEAVSPTKARKR